MKTKPSGSATKVGMFWATKYAGATTPAKLADIEYDRARAAIRDLDERKQAAAWRELAAAAQAVWQKHEAGDRQ